MKSKIAKLAAVAVITVAAVIGFNILNGTPVWAIEQTIEAFENIRTIIISGTSLYDSESIPFKCWIKLDQENNNLFNMRYECDREIVVVRGNVAFLYNPRSNRVKIVDGPTIHNLKFWYSLMELNPWVAGKILKVLQVVTGDWWETYAKDEQTGQDIVFVTCSYKPLNASFWLVVELENKLIKEGKHWNNINREGKPNIHAKSFVYNEKILDEIFDFKIPGGAKVINQKDWGEADVLFSRAEKLFHDKKQFAEAIKIYWQVYEKYPDLNIAESALMMIGICYAKMEQYEKAIEAYEKAIREYPNLKGWIEATYFYLGSAYMQTGQKDKALEAFRKCLKIGEGVLDSDTFPLKHARKYIEKLGNEN